MFTRWSFCQVLGGPQRRLGAILGGYCILSMTSINISSGAKWGLAGSEEISHEVRVGASLDFWKLAAWPTNRLRG